MSIGLGISLTAFDTPLVADVFSYSCAIYVVSRGIEMPLLESRWEDFIGILSRLKPYISVYEICSNFGGNEFSP